MAGISSLACVNHAINEAGAFRNPGELWEAMKRSLRLLSVDADAEAVSGLAILLAHDFPSFAERVIEVLVFLLKTDTGAREAVIVVMIINKLVLQGAVILGPSNPYTQLVKRHLAFLLHAICYHGGVVQSTFNECIKSWIMRGIYSPLFWQQVVQLESTWQRMECPMSRRPRDSGTALAENSPDVLDLVWLGIIGAPVCQVRMDYAFENEGCSSCSV